MSIPASLAISKLRYPETEETLTTGRCVIPDDDEHRAANSLHAFANGAWLGLKIAGMILATLLCIIALQGLANGLLTWLGSYLNISDPPLTVELIVGYICYPIAFLLGVPRNGDLLKVARLIGTKLIANEFVAYTALQTDPAYADLSPRSRLIATVSELPLVRRSSPKVVLLGFLLTCHLVRSLRFCQHRFSRDADWCIKSDSPG